MHRITRVAPLYRSKKVKRVVRIQENKRHKNIRTRVAPFFQSKFRMAAGVSHPIKQFGPREGF